MPKELVRIKTTSDAKVTVAEVPPALLLLRLTGNATMLSIPENRRLIAHQTAAAMLASYGLRDEALAAIRVLGADAISRIPNHVLPFFEELLVLMLASFAKVSGVDAQIFLYEGPTPYQAASYTRVRGALVRAQFAQQLIDQGENFL